MLNFKPLFNRIVVLPEKLSNVTKGGLVVPDLVKEKSNEGVVVAVGSGNVTKGGNLAPLTVQVGQKVMYGKYAGVEYKYGGETYLILSEDEVIAVLE